jgi:type II secretion system protein I
MLLRMLFFPPPVEAASRMKIKIFSNRAFTLIELMVAVSIFSVGTVVILQSFLANASTLSYMRNRITSMEILADKMSQLELEAIGTNRIASFQQQEEIEMNNHSAVLSAQAEPLFDSTMEEAGVSLVSLQLAWCEGGKNKDSKLCAFLWSK